MAIHIPEEHVIEDEALLETLQDAYAKWWKYYAHPILGFIRFLLECVYTSDEEARTDLGESAKKKFPIGKSYVEHFITYGILAQRLLVVPKSRRMTATWIVAAYCVWFAMFKEKRNVLWQAQTGAKSADTLKNKMLFIMENLPEDRIAPFVEVTSNKTVIPAGWDSRLCNYWTGKRDAAGLIGITFIKEVATATGGTRWVEDSRIIGIAEGQDQWRQYTVSLGVLDEFAFFKNAGDSIKGARPAVGLSGQLIFISSANPGYMKEMIAPPEGEQAELMANTIRAAQIPDHRGVNTWISKQGFFVYRLHYTADDAKNTPEWTMWASDDPTNPLAGRARQGYDQRQWNQEMEIDFSVHMGTPYYPEYNDGLHLKQMRPIPNVPVVLGWDFGLTPATTFWQVAPSGHLIALDEVVSEDNGIVQHSEVVIALLNQKYPWWKLGSKKGKGDIDWLLTEEEKAYIPNSQRMLTSYVDPAGLQRAQTDMRSPVDILRDLGLNPVPSIQDPVLRTESMKRGLRRLAPLGDTTLPAILVDPNCKVLLEGLRGGAQVGHTRFSKVKNFFSHVVESAEYVTVQYFRPVGENPIERAAMRGYGASDTATYKRNLKKIRR